MKNSDIAGRVADRIGLSQSASGNAVDAVFEAVGEALANGEEVRIAGLGTFGTRNRPARTGRNPQTGESLSIPASTAPAFKPGKALKDAVNVRLNYVDREHMERELRTGQKREGTRILVSTNLAEFGTDWKSLARLLGHSSPVVTMRYYVSIQDQTMRDAVAMSVV